MTLEEKLELFYHTVIEDATLQSTKMIEEYQEDIECQMEATKAELKKKEDEIFLAESEQLIHEKNKMVSQVVNDVKRQILEEEKSFQRILFNRVEEKLQEYMQTEDYFYELVKRIKEAKEFAGESNMTIYINASDQDKKEKLEKETLIPLEISNIDFLGGIRAVIRERNLMIDNSYLARLNEEKETCRM